MLARVTSCTVVGIEGKIVEVEVYLSSQLPGFDIVGLPDAAVREARDRVRAAIKNSGLDFPQQRIVANLAPADLKKEGPQLDLALAFGVLKASGQLHACRDKLAILGELALDGTLRPVRGVLSMVLAAREAGIGTVLLAMDNAAEAALVSGVRVWAARTLAQAVAMAQGKMAPPSPPAGGKASLPLIDDFSQVRGQEAAKRALEVAAAGGHNLLMTGPPGAGKTMLARSVPSILPSMSEEESLETTKIYSAAGLLGDSAALITRRPFRSPHHTVTNAALCGGGRLPRPGEVSLAHNGVLFLDELPEFRRDALESLRQPLEEGWITVTRLQATYTYPARLMLLASMNPCPCGLLSDPEAVCRCTAWQVQRYRQKVSGPLLDRFDLFVEVPRLRYEEVAGTGRSETSQEVRKRVEDARERQRRRYARDTILANAGMNPRQIRCYCQLDDAGSELMRQAFQRLHLSARAYYRILKVARTIADLDSSEKILPGHLAEAMSYRLVDPFGFTEAQALTNLKPAPFSRF